MGGILGDHCGYAEREREYGGRGCHQWAVCKERSDMFAGLVILACGPQVQQPLMPTLRQRGVNDEQGASLFAEALGVILGSCEDVW